MKVLTAKSLMSPNIGKHGKWKKTIAREERQAIFDEIVTQEFERLIADARPEYKLDRFMGKIPDEVRLNVSKSDIPAEAIEIVRQHSKRKLMSHDD